MRVLALLALLLFLSCSEKPKEKEVVSIYVASKEIHTAEKIGSENVTLVEFPKANLPEGASSDLEGIQGLRAGRVFMKGEVVLVKDLVKNREPIKLDFEPAMPAFTIKVVNKAEELKMMRPGDRINLCLLPDKKATRGPIQLIQNVRILSLGLAKEVEDDKPAAVSLEVTKKQATKAVIAKELGSFFLVPFNKEKTNSCVSGMEESYKALEEKRQKEAKERRLKDCREGRVTLGDKVFKATCPDGALEPL